MDDLFVMGLRGDAVCDRTFGTCDTNKRLLAFRVVCSPDGVTTTTTTTTTGSRATMRRCGRCGRFFSLLCYVFRVFLTRCVCVCRCRCSSMCPVAALYDARAV